MVKFSNFSLLSRLLSLIALCIILSALALVYLVFVFTSDLPNHEQLIDYKPPTITRLYNADSKVLAEYADERRIFTPFQDLPPLLVQTFLAAEDKNFFEHPGIDIWGICRAALRNLLNLGKSKRVEGGSTITQQVVKDFFLSNERSINRKIKEAILAYRLTKTYSKERILELYLNQIFLGNNSYGVTAAAATYFGKELHNLNTAEIALLAALPKAPSSLNPFLHADKAKFRRDWVIKRMYEEHLIDSETAANAAKQDIALTKKPSTPATQNGYYANYVKQQLANIFGEESLYKQGLIVNTYFDPHLQTLAESAMHRGLENLDRSKGWRGPITKLDITSDNWEARFQAVKKPSTALPDCELAIVTNRSKTATDITLQSGLKGQLSDDSARWASTGKNSLKVGDVILVRTNKSNNKKSHAINYSLVQVPKVNGAMVVIQNYTGRIIAMVGGYGGDYFNRATQALRQPGSAFKTVIYLSALENGYTPDTILLDAYLSLPQGPGLPEWTPKNYNNTFLGEVSLRTAFAKSLNTPTIRLLLSLGAEKTMSTAQRLGIYKHNDKSIHNAAVALGTLETTPLQMAAAHAAIASGGYDINARAIESVHDTDGNLLYYDSDISLNNSSTDDSPPHVSYFRNMLVRPESNREILQLLRAVVTEGTGAAALTLPYEIVGKTGTTNNSFDTWFIGSSSNFTVAVYVGYDQPHDLGAKSTGATVALPIFMTFMRQASENLANEKVGLNFRDFSIIPI